MTITGSIALGGQMAHIVIAGESLDGHTVLETPACKDRSPGCLTCSRAGGGL